MILIPPPENMSLFQSMTVQWGKFTATFHVWILWKRSQITDFDRIIMPMHWTRSQTQSKYKANIITVSWDNFLKYLTSSCSTSEIFIGATSFHFWWWLSAEQNSRSLQMLINTFTFIYLNFWNTKCGQFCSLAIFVYLNPSFFKRFYKLMVVVSTR